MENEITRQTNYIIAIHSISDYFAIENSIEEANAYLEKYPERKSVLISGSYANPSMKQIVYPQVQTFRKGELRLVDKMDASDVDVIDHVSRFFKNGLMILHNVDYSAQTMLQALKLENSKLDIINHRVILEIYPFEYEYINSEIERANQSIANEKKYRLQRNVYLRLHGDEHFPFNKEKLIELMNKFGQEVGGSIFLCQFILLRKKMEYMRLLEAECKKYDETFENFIDPHYFKKDSSNFIYLNLITKDILGADFEFLQQCQAEIVKMFENQ